MIKLKGLINKVRNKMSHYNIAHKCSKAIVCFLVILLLVINRQINSVYIDALAVIIWFFGVNAIAYIIETVLHFEHQHDKL